MAHREPATDARFSTSARWTSLSDAYSDGWIAPDRVGPCEDTHAAAVPLTGDVPPPGIPVELWRDRVPWAARRRHAARVAAHPRTRTTTETETRHA